MIRIVIISGSPASTSRLFALTDLVTKQLQDQGHEVVHIKASDLPAEALIKADFNHPQIIAANAIVAQADGVVIASPVYKAAYTGVLKTFLDLLPQKGLENKVTLPLFIGGTLAHLLSIDYSLKPLIHSLSGQIIQAGVYAIDEWVEKLDGGNYRIAAKLLERITSATKQFDQLIQLNTRVGV